jgi:hypothetical protein
MQHFYVDIDSEGKFSNLLDTQNILVKNNWKNPYKWLVSTLNKIGNHFIKKLSE